MPRLARKMEKQLLDENPELRDRGLVPVVLWVPDPASPGFAEEIREQSLRAARSPGERDAIQFIEAVADWPND